MTDFNTRMDNMLQEKLDYPIPAFLIEENKKILAELQKILGEGSYKKDKRGGDLGEQLARNFLVLHGYDSLKSNDAKTQEELVKWDILASLLGKEYKFEVKTDFLSLNKYYSIAIELESRGKLSGINVWNCDYVVFVIPFNKTIGFIKLKKLQNLMKTLQEGKEKNPNSSNMFGRRCENVGDIGSHTHIWSVPFDIFEANFTIVQL